jgi:AcrR family transcriptional regulator
MPKLVDPAAQRAEICAAARRVFAERGVAGTGLAHVADAAGMGRSSLYHYYPDKQSLLGDLAVGLLEEESALFDEVLRGEGSPLERIERLAKALVGQLDAYASVGRMLFDLRIRDARRFAPYLRRMRRELAHVIGQGQRDGTIDPDVDAALAASIWIGAVDGLLFQYFVDRRAFRDLEAAAQEVARAATRSLRR